MSTVTQPHGPSIDVRNPSSLQQFVLWFTRNQQQVHTELDQLLGITVDDSAAPSNVPTPTGIGVTAAEDGSMQVTLQWDYEDGDIPADAIIILFAQGTSPLSAPQITDSNVGLAPSTTTFTFQGLNPADNYRFAITTGRKSGSGLYFVGTIVSPTSSPDWADVSTTGNYTNSVGGVSASTVVTNAANGATAYSGTVNYRTSGAPNGSTTPSALAATLNTDGSVDYLLTFSHTPGSRKAEGFFLFVADGDVVPDYDDPHFELAAQEGASSYSLSLLLTGCSTDQVYSFGVASFRVTESGIQVAAIQQTTSSPDWKGVSSGTPNFIGYLSGLEQHTFEVAAHGLYAEEQDAYLKKDGVDSGNTAASGWNVQTYDLDTKTYDDFATYDVRLSGVIVDNYVINGTYETGDLTGWSAIGAGGSYTTNAFEGAGAVALAPSSSAIGVYNTASFTLDTGKDYILSAYFYVADFVAGSLRLACADSPSGGTVYVNIQVSANTNGWVYVSGKFTPTGTTAYVRIVSGSGSTFTGYADNIRLCENVESSDLADFINQQVGNKVLIIYSKNFLDNTSGSYRLTGGLVEALARIGASGRVVNSSAFQPRGAYILLGRPFMGRGNGIEVYNGATTVDTKATARLTFQTQGDKIFVFSSNGFSYSDTPGIPSTNPVPSAIAVTTTDTGQDEITFTWTHTQPALAGNNKTADFFVGYLALADYTDAATIKTNAVLAGKYAVGTKKAHVKVPHGSTVSFAVAAGRTTSDGEEVGNPVTSTTSPDWCGVTATSTVTTNGVGAAAITSPKIGTGAVGTTNLAAASVTSSKRQGNSKMGPTAFNVPANTDMATDIGSGPFDTDELYILNFEGQSSGAIWNNGSGAGARIAAMYLSATGHVIVIAHNGSNSAWASNYTIGYF